MAPDDVDYSAVNDHAQVMKPVEIVKAGLQAIVDEALKYESDIVKAESDLKAAKAKYRTLVEDTLPKALREAGFGEVGFPSTDGTVIKVADKVETSVLADRRNEAWDWLDKNGKGDVIKREVTIAFMVKEQDKADAAHKLLSDTFHRSVDTNRWVEPATLKSIITKMLEDQKARPDATIVDRELFGVREFQIATFKKPKPK